MWQARNAKALLCFSPGIVDPQAMFPSLNRVIGLLTLSPTAAKVGMKLFLAAPLSRPSSSRT